MGNRCHGGRRCYRARNGRPVRERKNDVRRLQRNVRRLKMEVRIIRMALRKLKRDVRSFENIKTRLVHVAIAQAPVISRPGLAHSIWWRQLVLPGMRGGPHFRSAASRLKFAPAQQRGQSLMGTGCVDGTHAGWLPANFTAPHWDQVSGCRPRNPSSTGRRSIMLGASGCSTTPRSSRRCKGWRQPQTRSAQQLTLKSPLATKSTD